MKAYQARDYQTRIIQNTKDCYIKDKFRSVLVVSPTGSGKTFMGLNICKTLAEHNPKLRFAWVAMRRKLLLQAAEENANIGAPNMEFVSMFDKTAPNADMVIVDECQHSAAATCADLIAKIKPSYECGLTGTPWRTDRVKLAYDKIISDCGVRFLIEQGYLCQFNQYVLPKFTPDVVAQEYLRDPARWGKSIMYFHDKEKCLFVEKKLNDAGIPAATVFGDQSPSEHDRIFDAFEEGKIMVLINVYLLTEGFNCEDLQTVFVRDSVKLPTIQMAGRVLRKDPKNHLKVANIVQSESTKYPYTKVTRPLNEFVMSNGDWKSITSNTLIDEVSEYVRNEFVVKSQEIILPSMLREKRGIGKIRLTRDDIVVNVPGKKSRGSRSIFDIDGIIEDENIELSSIV